MLFLMEAAGAFVAVLRLTTVDVLPSLDSLLALARRPVLVPGRDVGAREAAGAAFRPLTVPAVLEVALEAVGAFFVTPARVAFAFSTILERTLVAAADRDGPLCLNGEAGRATCVFSGDEGRSRFVRRELEEVGDNICAERTEPRSGAWAARALFFALSACSKSFSLSPEIASLKRELDKYGSLEFFDAYLIRF